MQDFTDIILTVTSHLRFRLESHNIPRFHLEVRASGETDDIGSTLIEYRLSKDAYCEAVRGNELHIVIDEFVRRHGWQAKNDAKLIPNRTKYDTALDEKTTSEEVPF